MPRKGFRAEEIIAKLREADVLLGQGKKVAEVVKALGVSEVSSGTSCSTGRSCRLGEAQVPIDGRHRQRNTIRPHLAPGRGCPRSAVGPTTADGPQAGGSASA